MVDNTQIPDDFLEDLDASQQEILEAVLTHRTRQAAADALGISRRTLYRRLEEPALAEMLRAVQDDARRATNAQLMAAAESVVDVLFEIARNTNISAYSRVGAARAILDYAYKTYENEELEARLLELEGRLT
jgi:hypothetical protein